MAKNIRQKTSVRRKVSIFFIATEDEGDIDPKELQVLVTKLAPKHLIIDFHIGAHFSLVRDGVAIKISRQKKCYLAEPYLKGRGKKTLELSENIHEAAGMIVGLVNAYTGFS